MKLNKKKQWDISEACVKESVTIFGHELNYYFMSLGCKNLLDLCEDAAFEEVVLLLALI